MTMYICYDHLIPTVIFCLSFLGSNIYAQNYGSVNIMDYISNMEVDNYSEIQRAIDDNPNRVIYFPDGTYKISSPIVTSADPNKSVCLELSNYAIIQPFEQWNNENAMICLGGKDPSNNILLPGSNYYLSGGIINCAGIAKGISIHSGRETIIRDTSIKNAIIGIHIKRGVNNGSSDSDIQNVNITGNQDKNSIGILIEGHDNNFSNIRIYNTQLGVMIASGGNHLRNIHVLYGSLNDSIYKDGCGFVNKYGNNWYDYCYSDQYATGFVIKAGNCVFHDCYTFWYSKRGLKHTAFKSYIPFNSIITNFTMGVNNKNATQENIILEEIDTSSEGTGCFQNLVVTHPELITTNNHIKYIKD